MTEPTRRTDPARQAKGTLRAQLRAKLAGVSSDQALRAGTAAVDQLSRNPFFGAASDVVAYSSLPGELDTAPVMEWARSREKPVLLPRMRDQSLEFVPVEATDVLTSARFGVLEPSSALAARDVAPGAVVFVPGLGFDHRGGRLGRGAGYYDRALARIQLSNRDIRLVGVAFALQIVDRVPMSRHDVRMHAVLTETDLHWVDASDRENENLAHGSGKNGE